MKPNYIFWLYILPFVAIEIYLLYLAVKIKKEGL